MSSGGAANPGASHTSLRDLAQAALARRPPSLRMPPLLRDRYEAEHALPRALELRRTTAAGACIYVFAVLVVNSLLIQHPNWADIAMQITVTPAAALLIASLFFRPDMPPPAREAAATVVAGCFSLATVLAVDDAPGESPYMSFLLACLPMFYVLAFVRLRFLSAAAFSAFSVLALTVALAVRGDVSPLALASAAGLMLAAAVLALLMAYRLHLRAQRRYLQAMLQSLHPEGEADVMTELGP
jgi:hypothetical protein